MHTISKEFTFCASHILEGLPDDHPCGRMHGHNYVVTVYAASDALDANGMVIDYGEFDLVKQWLDKRFDHRHLNDVMDDNPTAENIAALIFKMVDMVWPEVTFAVTVSETPKTTATYAEVPTWTK